MFDIIKKWSMQGKVEKLLEKVNEEKKQALHLIVKSPNFAQKEKINNPLSNARIVNELIAAKSIMQEKNQSPKVQSRIKKPDEIEANSMQVAPKTAQIKNADLAAHDSDGFFSHLFSKNNKKTVNMINQVQQPNLQAKSSSNEQKLNKISIVTKNKPEKKIEELNQIKELPAKNQVANENKGFFSSLFNNHQKQVPKNKDVQDFLDSLNNELPKNIRAPRASSKENSQIKERIIEKPLIIKEIQNNKKTIEPVKRVDLAVNERVGSFSHVFNKETKNEIEKNMPEDVLKNNMEQKAASLLNKIENMDKVNKIDSLKAEPKKQNQEALQNKEIKGESKGFFSHLFSKKINEEESPKTSGKKISDLIHGKVTISEKEINKFFRDWDSLFNANKVSPEVINQIRNNISKDLINIEINKEGVAEKINNSVKNLIFSSVIDPPDLIKQIKSKNKTFEIIFFGAKNSGKTTSIAKIAGLLQRNDISCVLVACDTTSTTAISQLDDYAKNLDLPITKANYGTDPTLIAEEARKYAKSNKIKCILMDTPGAMDNENTLIDQIKKIIKSSTPDLKIFVGESITNNGLTQQAIKFNEKVGLDGIILTKADVEDKWGAALSVSYAVKKPIYFVGTGKKVEDLIPFKKEEVLGDFN